MAGATAVHLTESQSHQQDQEHPKNEEIVADASELEAPRDLIVPRKKALLPYAIGGLVVSGTLAVALGWYFFASPVARINRAVDTGKLVVPEGSSAYDLYRRFKPDLSARALNGMREKALPKLNAAGEIFLQKRAEGSSFKESEVRQLASIYDWAADLAPGDNKILSRRNYVQGMAASLRGDPSAALQFLQDSVKYDGNWAPAYNELGKAYVRLRDHSHAAENYRKAIDLDPKWVFPQVNLAGVYLHNREWDLAEQGYLQAIQTDGTYATAWYFLGQTYEAQKRPSDAIAAYENAVQLAATRPSSAFRPDIVQRHVENLKSKPVSFAAAATAVEATNTVNGYLSDSKCGAKGANPNAAECTKKCIEEGATMVVVTDGDQRVLTVENPDALTGYEGHHLAVTGHVNGDSVHVESVKML